MECTKVAISDLVLEASKVLAPNKEDMEALLATWESHQLQSRKDQAFLTGLQLARQVLNSSPDVPTAVLRLKAQEMIQPSASPPISGPLIERPEVGGMSPPSSSSPPLTESERPSTRRSVQVRAPVSRALKQQRRTPTG